MKKYRFTGYLKFSNVFIVSKWYKCNESIKMTLNRKIWLEEIAYNVNIEYLKTC